MNFFNLKSFIIAIAIITLGGMTSCTGSSDDIDKVSYETTPIVLGAKLILSMSTSSTSRIDAATTSSDAESYISGLRVYFCDNNNNIEYVVSTYDNVANPSSVVVSLDKEGIPAGTYNIYVGANTTSSLNSLLVKGANMASAVAGISSVSEVASANKFVMFGQAANVTIAQGATNSASINLIRVVAKMIVTATADANNCIEDPNGIADIKISDVTFTVNTTNSKFYPMANTVNGTVEDPNYSMVAALQNMNSFLNEGTSKSAQAYDASKINDASYISNSIYCLENTTDAPAQVNAQKVATYIHVTVKATPKLIDGKAFANVALTNNTFYTYSQAAGADKYLCFSSKANLKAVFGAGVAESSIIAHSTNDTYSYDTYVNGKAFSASSSVVRNNYYIINIAKINTPFVDKTIELNTAVTGWNVQGTTIQTIDTSAAK